MEAVINQKNKLVTDDNVNLTNCRKAVRKLRNCQHCLKRNTEACKQCVPRPVVDEINAALTLYFRFVKENKKHTLSIVDNKSSTSDINSEIEKSISEVDDYNF